MRKVLFVNPSYTGDVLESVRVLSVPPMSLAALAGLTPRRYVVEIVDEAHARVDFDRPVDLVAITCMTPLAPRAYAISAEFRRRGVPVVLGGIHPSMMSEEAAQHADAVVIGEAETVWPRVLQDAEAGALQRRYTGDPPEMAGLPVPRRDLLPRGYFVQTVQTSRGCPFDCSFCSVTRFNGGRYRYRPVGDVLREIRQLPGRQFFFSDDNIIGSGPASTKRALELFDRLKELGKAWGSQCCIHVVENEALLRRAADSGARWLFVGFESIDRDTLATMNKRINLRGASSDFADAVKKLHDHGIAVIGGFIFGSDTDTRSVFDRTVEFVQRHAIDAAQFSIQTPFPGTRLHEQLSRENRLLYRDYPADWRRYNGFEVVFRPRQMTVDQLREGHRAAYRATATLTTSLSRAIKTLLTTRSVFGTAAAYCWNHDCYRALRRLDRPALALPWGALPLRRPRWIP